MKQKVWCVGQVVRTNAGSPLYNAVRIADGKEADCTPTHSEQVAQRIANALNADIEQMDRDEK